MKLIITIDTEEDNWGNYSPTDYTLSNIERIPSLQQLFDDFNVKPTYLINYPVASNEKAVAILREILDSGRCEIGSHCHPWNTPPVEEELDERNSMLCNLDFELQYKKLKSLHKKIIEGFDIEPLSFRSGRWGYNQNVAKNLYRLGYKIDTSITPYTDWTMYYGANFTDISPRPFRFSCANIFRESANGDMVEVPATIGFLQYNFERCNSIIKILRKPPMNRLRLLGILSKLNIINKVWISPELFDSNDMIKLTKCLIAKEFKLINMMFHSPSLKAGLTPFVKSVNDASNFLNKIKEYLIFARDTGIESIKLRDSLNLIGQWK